MRDDPTADDDALVRLLIAERRSIIAYARSIVFDQDLAEDVYQNAAVVVLRKQDEVLKNLRQGESETLLRWVLRVARLEALTILRKRRNTPFMFSEEVLDLLDNSWKEELDRQSGSESDVSDALEGCVRKLTERGRKILRLRYGKGLSGQALATELGSELNTAYVALSRVHKQLRTCMADRLGS